MQIIPALWSGEAVTFNGRFYQLTNAVCRPAQNPPPRLIAAAILPASARLAGKYARCINFPWVVQDRFARLFEALDMGLAERRRNRAGFDVSLHVRWPVLESDPLQALEQGEKMGFTGVIIYLSLPFPLAEIEALAQLLQ